jgi:hypothetical protein
MLSPVLGTVLYSNGTQYMLIRYLLMGGKRERKEEKETSVKHKLL